MGASIGSKRRDENLLSITNNKNPNTIFPCLRNDDAILKERVKIETEICKSHFLFKKVIGKGQFGLVWLAQKLHTNVDVVIKVMDKTIIFNKRCVDTVMLELDLMTQLMHPLLANL
jgi:serine/threonine protein kinase